MGLLFMCVKHKCLFYFQKYDILLIFVDFYVSFPWFWLIFLLIIDTDPDPGSQNDADPDPHHCSEVTQKIFEIVTSDLIWLASF